MGCGSSSVLRYGQELEGPVLIRDLEVRPPPEPIGDARTACFDPALLSTGPLSLVRTAEARPGETRTWGILNVASTRIFTDTAGRVAFSFHFLGNPEAGVMSEWSEDANQFLVMARDGTRLGLIHREEVKGGKAKEADSTLLRTTPCFPRQQPSAVRAFDEPGVPLYPVGVSRACHDYLVYTPDGLEETYEFTEVKNGNGRMNRRGFKVSTPSGVVVAKEVGEDPNSYGPSLAFGTATMAAGVDMVAVGMLFMYKCGFGEE